MHHQDSAMTEIALALAMGFFSIMVLTLISFGSTGSPATRADALEVIEQKKGSDTPGTIAPTGDDLVIIFDGTRYLDVAMQPVDPATVGEKLATPDQRVILAIDPATPLRGVIKARNRLAIVNLVVSNLNPKWLQALNRQQQKNR